MLKVKDSEGGMNYPVRCVIVDGGGDEIAPGVVTKTPEISKPHLGKRGLAEDLSDGVRITLDDGNVLWGYDCWWVTEADHDAITIECNRRSAEKNSSMILGLERRTAKGRFARRKDD